MNVKDKTILITGGAGGLGSAMVRLLAREGAYVFILDMDRAKGEALRDDVIQSGGRAEYVGIDVTKEADWESAIRFAVEKTGRVDVLVNNAGINIRKPIEEMVIEEWNTMMAVNTGSVFLGCKYAIPVMRAQGGGAIINLGFCFIRLAKVKDLSLKADFSLAKPLITHNVLLSALGGLMWYLQFFFYAWGHARIPAQYDYISWMLHMSFYVLCGGIVGLVLKEWNNAGRRPVTVLSLGCVVIIVAANIVGIGMAN